MTGFPFSVARGALPLQRMVARNSSPWNRMDLYRLPRRVEQFRLDASPINSRARYGNQEGPFELQLAVTRDLRNWQRPFRIPCVARGAVGDWECGIQQTAARAIRVGDEIWLYYCGANYTHGTPVLYRPDDPGRKIKYTSSIGLAKWKLDRFVSADGLTADGKLTTVPVVFSGNRLELNSRTKAGEIDDLNWPPP